MSDVLIHQLHLNLLMINWHFDLYSYHQLSVKSTLAKCVDCTCALTIVYFSEPFKNR